MTEIIIPILLVLLLHYLFFITSIFIGLGRLKKNEIKNSLDEFISVIIPFRNESDTILKNLKCIEKQNYPGNKYEVIYVNDNSDDDSYEKICRAEKPENIFVLNVPVEFSVNAHKKRAVRYGIEKAKGDIIVTTDADCFFNENWLKNILNEFDENTAFVSGPVEFVEGKTIFSKIQKLEFAGLVLTGAGLIGFGNPIICNAANIAYRKKIYSEVNGFRDQMNLSSGDDELLMQKIAADTEYKIKFCLNKDALVKTEPNKTAAQFYQQRKRWASKGLFYADKMLILKLILIFLFYLSLHVQFMAGFIFSSIYFFTFIISFSFKCLFEYLVMNRGAKMLFSYKMLKPFLLAEILQIPYIIIAGISGALGNFTWKERKIKR